MITSVLALLLNVPSQSTPCQDDDGPSFTFHQHTCAGEKLTAVRCSALTPDQTWDSTTTDQPQLTPRAAMDAAREYLKREGLIDLPVNVSSITLHRCTLKSQWFYVIDVRSAVPCDGPGGQDIPYAGIPVLMTGEVVGIEAAPSTIHD